MTNVYEELERGVFAALETYSNVHRGTGHNSMVSTHLYEQARDIVLEYLGLNKGKYVVIFCSPARAAILMAQLKPESYKSVSSQDIGLSLGVLALAVKRKALPKGAPLQTGGGTTRLVSPGWVVWAKAPDRFEAGTPAIISVIAFARALKLIRQSGNETTGSIWKFGDEAINQSSDDKLTATQILYHDELDEFSGRELLNELRKTMIGRNVFVPTTEGTRRYINLDNGASTPTFTPVWNAVCRTWRQPAQIQQEIIQEVRSICTAVLGASLTAYDVIFTSNTTEAINLAADSLGRESADDIEPVVINTILEHNSNDLPWRMLPGCSLIRLEADAEGFLDLNELDALLCEYNQEETHGKKRIRLVAVSGASNVLGTFNNLEEISRIVHRYGARLLVDAAQMVAHRKVEVEQTGIDYLAFSAHKVYAPFGTGVLLARKGMLNFSPSELELIQSSGEENAGGIAALGKALVLLQRIGLDLVREEEQVLTGRALRGLAQIANLSVYGIKDPDSPGFAQKGGVIVFAFKDKFSNVVAKELAEQGGIGIRNGCHCSHMLVKRLLKVSPGLERFQHLIAILLQKVSFPGVARISMGIGNSEEDIDTLIQVLGEIASRQKGKPVTPKADVKVQMSEFLKTASERVY
jgi:selenocysteine lyase/cysteine desulfurase